ncbi:hypothetical protein ABEF95_007060 [Exophiala dermatitidis]
MDQRGPSSEDDEDEYEYEYDDNETETFYVDLDLSSLNSTIKPNVSGDPKPLIPSKRPREHSEQQTPDPDAPTPHTPGPVDVEENGEGLVDQGTGTGAGTPSMHARDTIEEDDNDGGPEFSGNVQILDLDTSNPIISYRDHVYSCTWTDMVGTNMFFTAPRRRANHTGTTLQSTDDYDLIGMSRIKLVGNRATMTKKSKRTQAENAREESETLDGEEPDGRSLGDIHRTNPQHNMQMKKQAMFLEKLMDVKQRRGETDAVRAYVDDKIASADYQKLPQTVQPELGELNRRLVRGDGEALSRLQQIYSSQTAEKRDTEGGHIPPEDVPRQEDGRPDNEALNDAPNSTTLSHSPEICGTPTPLTLESQNDTKGVNP